MRPVLQRRLAAELEAIGRLVALHLEKASTIALLERANNDMAEAHLTLECDPHCLIVENAVLASIARPREEHSAAWRPIWRWRRCSIHLQDLHAGRHVGISHAESALPGSSSIHPVNFPAPPLPWRRPP